jgi:hypothetical protein
MGAPLLRGSPYRLALSSPASYLQRLQDSPSRNKRETFLKDSDRTMPLLKPFNGWDYLLCAIAYLLIGIAAVPKLATLIFGR